MVQAAPASSSPQPRPRLWLGPLVAGLCFGLGYGLTQRLVDLNVRDLVRFGQPFDVQPFPGTSLGSLRLRFGDEEQQIRGSLELDQLERQPDDLRAEPDPEPDRPEPAPPEPSLERQPPAEPAAERPVQPPAIEEPAGPATPPPPAPASRP